MQVISGSLAALLGEPISCTTRSQRACQEAKGDTVSKADWRWNWRSRWQLDTHHLVYLLGSSFRPKWPSWQITFLCPTELLVFEARLKRLISPTSTSQSVHGQHCTVLQSRECVCVQLQSGSFTLPTTILFIQAVAVEQFHKG